VLSNAGGKQGRRATELKELGRLNYSELLSGLLYYVSSTALRRYRYGRKRMKIFTIKPVIATLSQRF
jgi:hypothetical protein